MEKDRGFWHMRLPRPIRGDPTCACGLCLAEPLQTWAYDFDQPMTFHMPKSVSTTRFLEQYPNLTRNLSKRSDSESNYKVRCRSCMHYYNWMEKL